MPYQFAHDRLHAAVLLLAQGSGPVQERLARVYTEVLVGLSDRDLPVDLRYPMAVIKRALSADPLAPLILEDAHARRLAAELVEILVVLVRLDT